MTSINSNSACHPIVETLATSNLNPQFVSDAARILSVLKPFDQTAYCQNGCKAIRKLFHEIALKVHPDKCRNNEMATPAYIKAREARDTLCGADANRELCDAGKPNYGVLSEDATAFESLWEEVMIFSSEAQKLSLEQKLERYMEEAMNGDHKNMHNIERLWREGTLSSFEAQKSIIRTAFLSKILPKVTGEGDEYDMGLLESLWADGTIAVSEEEKSAFREAYYTATMEKVKNFRATITQTLPGVNSTIR
jgi:hypothetical protein